MADSMASVCRLHKRLQEDDLTIPDVLEARDGTVSYFELMDEAPIPGGKEEAVLLLCAAEESGAEGRTHRNSRNKYVTSSNRSMDAIRTEIVAATKNFLS